MLYRFQLSYDEIIVKLDLEYIPATTIGFTLLPGMYKKIDIKFLFKSLLLKEVKLNVTVDDVRLKSVSITNKTFKFSKKSFFYTRLGFTQSILVELGGISGFIQVIPGSYKNDTPVNITGIDKVHLKCDCNHGSIVNGTREPILYSFALSSPPGHEINKKPSVKFFKKINKSVLSYTTFYLEDDDHKPIDFSNETKNFYMSIN